MMNSADDCRGTPLSRRRFVQCLTLGALASPLHVAGRVRAAQVLTAPQVHLQIEALGVRFAGRTRLATAVNGQIPGPLLRWRQGDTVTVHVTNRLSVPTSIHWHGILVPADMDGVPGLSFEGIAPGQTFSYRLPLRQAGTYFYHSHSRFQEQTGLYGAIVIEPRAGERWPAAHDYTVLLSDWSDLDPEEIYRWLKVSSDHFQYGQRTLVDLERDAHRAGAAAALDERLLWGRMRMSPTDLADVTGAAYTYLMNGMTPTGNWTALFRPGARVRLRFINAASMSFFDVRIPGLKLTVVAADGQDVAPVSVDEFRLGVGEVLDCLLEPQDRPYPLFAQTLDRSGFARGTLTPRAGLEAEVPLLDPRPILGLTDMGMAPQAMSRNAGPDAGARLTPHLDMSPMEMGHMDMGAAHSGAAGVAAGSFGPLVAGRAPDPQSRLGDPGVGLRGNGRRVLTYEDLHTLGGPLDARLPEREIVLHLTGHMQRYVWSFDGRKFSEAEPLRFAYDERVRIVLVNDTMMLHPIHLHGMWSELLDAQGAFQARKHTVTVQPGQRVAYAVSARALGRWAYHCHLLYHMEAGMFREVQVSGPPGEHS